MFRRVPRPLVIVALGTAVLVVVVNGGAPYLIFGAIVVGVFMGVRQLRRNETGYLPNGLPMKEKHRQAILHIEQMERDLHKTHEVFLGHYKTIDGRIVGLNPPYRVLSRWHREIYEAMRKDDRLLLAMYRARTAKAAGRHDA